MDFIRIKNALILSSKIMERVVGFGDSVVDCTMGNGNDSLKLAQLVGNSGRVFSFDIQKEAIEISKSKLEEEGLLNRVSLINDGHENIDKYILKEVDFIIYNLGYLPGGNKEIVTKSETTVESIIKGLSLLSPNGTLLVVSYIGHSGGMDENNEIEIMFESLEQREYNVVKFQFFNQKNNPPIVYMIEKSKK